MSQARHLLLLWALLCGAAAAAEATASPAAVPDGDLGEAGDSLAQSAYAEGRDALARGDALAAMAAFRAALREDPAMVAALTGMGVALDRVGRFDLARPYYETALALEPASADILYNFALSLSLQGRDEAAYPLLTQAAGLGDATIRTSALKLMSRLDARRQRQAVAMAAASDAPAPAPAPPAAETAARLVRVGQGEWMLDARPDAPPQSAEALATVPRWTAEDEAALAAQEEALAAADAAADGAAAPEHAAGSVALAAARPGDLTDPLAPAPAQAGEDLPQPRGEESAWLLLAPSAHLVRRDARRLPDVLAADLGPTSARARGPAPRRFASPFASDDPRLNAFAERMQGLGTDSIGRRRAASAADSDRAGFAALTAALAAALPAAAAGQPRALPAFASDDAALNAFAARLAG